MGEELYLSYSSAFLIGLLGSTHCLSMCGGISASLSMALPVGRGFRGGFGFGIIDLVHLSE